MDIRRDRFRPARGFSLVELLVVVGIVVILFSIFVPYLSKIRESDRRVRCAENLRAIHTALSAYSKISDGEYPRVRFDPARPGYVAYTGTLAPDPFPPTQPATAPTTAVAVAAPPVTGAQVAANDVTASLWLLVRGGLIEPQRFVCPSSDDTPDPMTADGRRAAATERSNFTSGRHLSYSYACPFSLAPKYRLNTDMLPDFAVMADRNPGTSPAGDDVTRPRYDAPPIQLAAANSNNHNKAGQNVLYADGHVQFQQTAYCGYGNGWQRDNVFTAYAPAPVPPGTEPAPEANGVAGRDVGPAWEKDSYLVPTDDE